MSSATIARRKGTQRATVLNSRTSKIETMEDETMVVDKVVAVIVIKIATLSQGHVTFVERRSTRNLSAGRSLAMKASALPGMPS